MAASGNPFRPAPGSEPPALVGRSEELSAVRYSLDLVASGAPAQPIVFTGLRGMGKTVLLRRCLAAAESADAVVIYGEASRTESLSHTLQQGLQRALRNNSSFPQRLKRGLDKILEVLPLPTYELPNGMGAVALGTSAKEPAELIASLEELNETARKHGRFLLFAIDEIQEAPVAGLRDLVRLIHASAGTDRPAYLLAAGLPNSREHLHDVRTYTERWRYFRLHLLTPEETKDAMLLPLRERGMSIAPKALEHLVTESAGYPFFVQEYASAAWLAHTGKTITEADVAAAVPGVRRILEDDFYESRFRRLTARECAYVLAMAELGPGAHTAGEVAEHFNVKSDALSSIRNQLIKKDVIYSPAGGMVEFRIPLTERYVLGHRDELERRARSSSAYRRIPR